MLSCEFCEISKNTFFTEHLRTIASAYVKLMVIHNIHKIHAFYGGSMHSNAAAWILWRQYAFYGGSMHSVAAV